MIKKIKLPNTAQLWSAARTMLPDGRPDVALVAILVFAFLLRIIAISVFPSLHYPDENFQAFEQGHRLAFGYGISTWEFDDGIRSPVIPYLLGGIFTIAYPLFGGPGGYIFAAQVILAMLSLCSVGAVYLMGATYSRIHALMAGVAAASWFEIVYFSFRPLSEAVCVDFLLPGVACATCAPSGFTKRKLVVAGFCLGVSLMLRVHILPGVMFLAIWIGRFDFAGRWLPLCLGALPPVLGFGLADWVVWGAPFYSYIESISINLLQARAEDYGVSSPYWYFIQIAYLWRGALFVLLILAFVGARISPAWLGVALAIIVGHSLISHKEYRFIYPAMACLIVAAALGSATISIWLLRQIAQKWREGIVASVALTWIVSSVCLGFGTGFYDKWFTSRKLIYSFFWLSRQPELCGLLLYNIKWTSTGGYTYLHRNLPIYAIRNDVLLANESASAFNFIIASPQLSHKFGSQFELSSCTGSENIDDICVIHRPGGCRRSDKLIPLTEQKRLAEQIR
jgi:GPI mannosyltransferase 3